VCVTCFSSALLCDRGPTGSSCSSSSKLCGCNKNSPTLSGQVIAHPTLALILVVCVCVTCFCVALLCDRGPTGSSCNSSSKLCVYSKSSRTLSGQVIVHPTLALILVVCVCVTCFSSALLCDRGPTGSSCSSSSKLCVYSKSSPTLSGQVIVHPTLARREAPGTDGGVEGGVLRGGGRMGVLWWWTMRRRRGGGNPIYTKSQAAERHRLRVYVYILISMDESLYMYICVYICVYTILHINRVNRILSPIYTRSQAA